MQAKTLMMNHSLKYYGSSIRPSMGGGITAEEGPSLKRRNMRMHQVSMFRPKSCLVSTNFWRALVTSAKKKLMFVP